MKKFDKIEKFSIRKFKVGVGSALIGLSFLGITGLVNDVPVIGDMFKIQEVHAVDKENDRIYGVPIIADPNDQIGTATLVYRAGGWTMESPLPPGYAIHNVNSARVRVYKINSTPSNNSYDSSNSSSSNSSSSGSNGPGTSGNISQPDRHSKIINVRYNVVNRDPSTIYSFESVTVQAHETNDRGWTYTVTAPEGFVFAKNNQITSVEYSSTEPSDSVVLDIKESVIYQSDDNFDVGYINRTRRSNSVYVTKGTKPTVTKTPIDFTTRYVKDSTRNRGAENITETEGSVGELVITVRHSLNPTTGEVTDLPATESRTEPTNKVVKVAAKDKVVYSKEDNKIVKTTTTYIVNPNNGNITETSAKEIISEDGTKDKVVTEVLASPIRYEKDDTREKGSEDIRTEGKTGTKVTTTTYEVNPKTGEVIPTVHEPVITPATETVVKVAAKDKVVYSKKGDDVIKTTTIYTVNPRTGDITEKTTEEVFKQNGAKDTIETSSIPSPVRYEKDTTRDKGQPNIENKGVDGVSSVTTTYTVNPQTGVVTPTVGEPIVTKQATETVIKVAAKDKEEVTEIPSPKKYIKDSTREKGQPNITKQGNPGSSTVTTTYDVSSNDGTITEHKGTPVIVNPTDTIIEVAAKDKVEIIKDGNNEIERATTYIVNENTGEITEEIVDKIISTDTPLIPNANGTNEPELNTNEKPEYTGPLSTNTPVDDKGELVLPPVVDELPEFNGGVNSTEPPVEEKSEYTSPISTNTPIDDKGNLELPPVVDELPEFNGGVNSTEPPVEEKSEYTSPISTNTPIDDKGNLELPPVLDVEDLIVTQYLDENRNRIKTIENKVESPEKELKDSKNNITHVLDSTKSKDENGGILTYYYKSVEKSNGFELPPINSVESLKIVIIKDENGKEIASFNENEFDKNKLDKDYDYISGPKENDGLIEYIYQTKVNIPKDKLPVKEFNKLTNEEKELLKEKVKEVNPNKFITIGEDGLIRLYDKEDKTDTVQTLKISDLIIKAREVEPVKLPDLNIVENNENKNNNKETIKDRSIPETNSNSISDLISYSVLSSIALGSLILNKRKEEKNK